jgi:hypothetical protein
MSRILLMVIFWVCKFVLLVVVGYLVKCLNNSIKILAAKIVTTIFKGGGEFSDCLSVLNQL